MANNITPRQSGILAEAREINGEREMVLVVGESMHGKSKFIERMCTIDGKPGPKVGGGAESCTNSVQAWEVSLPAGPVYLVDTIGMNDTNLDNQKVLSTIFSYYYFSKILGFNLRGLIYVIDINVGVNGPAAKSLEYFYHLCGPNTMPSVRFLTTKWDKLTDDHEVRRRRMERLMNKDLKKFVDGQAKVLRADTSPTWAKSLVTGIIGASRGPISLLVDDLFNNEDHRSEFKKQGEFFKNILNATYPGKDFTLTQAEDVIIRQAKDIYESLQSLVAELLYTWLNKRSSGSSWDTNGQEGHDQRFTEALSDFVKASSAGQASQEQTKEVIDRGRPLMVVVVNPAQPEGVVEKDENLTEKQLRKKKLKEGCKTVGKVVMSLIQVTFTVIGAVAS